MFARHTAWARSTFRPYAAFRWRWSRASSSALSGPSGSGKSTLFYIMGGLTHADSGRVLIDGVNFTELSDAARTRMRKTKIGFVFQKFNLLPTLTAKATSTSRSTSPAMPKTARSPVHRTHRSVAGHRQAPEPPPVGDERRRAAARRTGAGAGKQARDRAGRRAHRQPRHRRIPRSCCACCASPTKSWARRC